jgi:hypothetical protein
MTWSGEHTSWQVPSAIAPILRHAPELGLKSLSLLWPPNAAVTARNAFSLRRTEPWLTDAAACTDERLLGSLDAALGWLCRSQDAVGSGGVGCFEFYRWTKGYPEVTGYIVPTFWDCAGALDRPELAERAVRMTDWELEIQRADGGWEGGYDGDRHPTVVFNTGQVLRGLLRSYAETKDQRYLDAAARGGSWIVANQEPDGSWARANFKGMRRVYDSYVSAPLARLAQITGDDRYRDAALRNCAFVIANQRDNGWFENADNSPYYNDAPVTHTICYTIDGLIETGQLLGEQGFVDAGRRAADGMVGSLDEWPLLYGRLGSSWEPRTGFACLTGVAQFGLVCMRLHALTGDRRYVETARKLLGFLVWTQRLNGVGGNRRGAIAGSFPIWGLYCPLKYPSWATKYFADLTLAMLGAGELDEHPQAGGGIGDAEGAAVS